MREIKYKAWDSRDCFMAQVIGMQFDPETSEMIRVVTGDETGGYEYEGDDLRHVQVRHYTGLKDKNGVEIYEGDIIAKLKQSDGYSAGREYKTVFWNHGVNRNGWNIAKGDTWEIVGNIYENPELLKGVGDE